MAETTDWASTVWEGDGEIQPEGGLHPEDILDAEDFDEGTLQVFDETDESEETDGAGGEPSPTTETATDADASDAEETAPTPEQGETAAEKKLKFHAKVDRKDTEVEISENELPVIYQKSNNFDRLQKRFDEKMARLQGLDALSAQLGFASAEEMLEHAVQQDRDAKIAALVDGGTARDIAEDYVDRSMEKARTDYKLKSIETAQEETVEQDGADDPKNTAPEDYSAQVTELFRVRPDLKGKLQKLPDEVTKEVVEHGVPLRTAYAEWETRQIKAENERIRKEKDLFAQQAETAARAPARGAKDGSAKSEKIDPFIQAFRSERGY